MIALFLATFEFAMLITNKNKKLSLIVTMLITFSPLVHWWFAVNNLVEMIVFAEIAIVLIDKYLLESNFKKRIFYKKLLHSETIYTSDIYEKEKFHSKEKVYTKYKFNNN